jgi:hypothetical protein
LSTLSGDGRLMTDSPRLVVPHIVGHDEDLIGGLGQPGDRVAPVVLRLG